MKSFKDYGYLLMAIPRSGVMPLDLLHKSEKGVLSRYEAPVNDLFLSNGIASPQVGSEVDLPGNISAEEELNLSVAAHVGLLNALVKMIKTKLNANVKYDSQSKALLRLNDPKSQTVNLMQLDKFLQSATLDESAAGTVDKLFKGELYVITEVIKAKSFTIENKSNVKVEVGADVEVPEIVTGGTRITSGKDRQASITYEGSEYLTFGIMAKRIVYDKPGLFSKRKGIFKLEAPKGIVLTRGKEKRPSDQLTGSEGILAFDQKL